GEVRRDDRRTERRERAEISPLLGGGDGAHEVDDIPPLLWGQAIGEAGHGRSPDAVGDQPEELAGRTVGGALPDEIRGPARRSGSHQAVAGAARPVTRRAVPHV